MDDVAPGPRFLSPGGSSFEHSAKQGRIQVAYPNGMFTWTDISLADVAAGKEFYEELFGWDGEDQFDPDGNLIYVMFSKDGESVSGMGPQPPGTEAAGHPPMWQSYVTVDSVDDTVTAVLGMVSDRSRTALSVSA